MKNYNAKDGIDERLRNAETQLSIHITNTKSVFDRLKLIEDRLLHLESISPEYVQFWVSNLRFLFSKIIITFIVEQKHLYSESIS